jgi:hypothetical protein
VFIYSSFQLFKDLSFAEGYVIEGYFGALAYLLYKPIRIISFLLKTTHHDIIKTNGAQFPR